MFEISRIKIAVIALGSFWTLVLAASLWGNHLGMQRQVREIAKSQAEVHFERDRAMRVWAGGHGGVYVPVSPRTQPNPALSHLANRDFVGPDGRMLTLMNPAYMIRQINEDMSDFAKVRNHMTSLKPLRSENGAEGWEREALTQFESGVTEISNTLIGDDGAESLNFMRPLFIGEGCLKCHGQQGYKVGDVRGGVAISVPLTNLQKAMAERWTVIQGSHILIWALGMGGLIFGVRIQAGETRKRNGIAQDLEEAVASTEAVLDSLPMGVVLVGRDKVIRRINRTALDILGKEENEVLNHTCHQHFCPAQVDHCPILDLKSNVDSSEKVVLGADGKMIPVIKSVIPFVYHGEDVLLEAFVDISERKESIKRMAESLDDLRRFNRLAVDRELRMVELKSEINELLKESGQRDRYKVVATSIREVSR